MIENKIEIITENFKKQSSLPGQVKYSHYSKSPNPKIQMPTPKSSIQNQKDKCKIAHFIMQTLLTLTFHICANYATVCSVHSATYFSCKFLTPEEC